jgi:tetratricopeptide (TPR) repeat protein
MGKRAILIAAALVMAIGSVPAAAQQRVTDTVMILPFENTSDKSEFNWVGESIATALSDLLRVPGLNVVSNSERKLIQQRLRVPLTSIPSLATSLKLAREGGATLLVAGRYDIIPEQEDIAATINITARIIRVNEGRFLSEELPDGRRITRDIVLHDALGNLQTIQGQIAYQILYQRDKALPFSQNQLIESANKIPPRAFEAYIKGLLTPDTGLRENYFKNAVRLFADSSSGGTYSAASLELGHLYMAQRRFADAVGYFDQVINADQQCKEQAKGENRPTYCNDEGFAEASFFIGLIHYEQGRFEQALSVLRPLADDLKLTSVYNLLGSIGVLAARAERRDAARSAALLNEGIGFLRRAAESAPDDIGIKFNLGLAQFLQEDHLAAAETFKEIIARNPRDGEGFYLLAKSLAELKDEASVGLDDQARVLLSGGNRYATLERDWQKAKSVTDIGVRVVQPQRKDFASVVLSQRETATVQTPVSGTEALIHQARTHYKNGNDDEAMAVLRRVLVSEPMSAESYVILGNIHLRRGDRDQAISAMKTAIFWDNRQIEAHIALGRIYLERGDCMQARTFAITALEIDGDDPSALGLQRQADRCSK